MVSRRAMSVNAVANSAAKRCRYAERLVKSIELIDEEYSSTRKTRAAVPVIWKSWLMSTKSVTPAAFMQTPTVHNACAADRASPCDWPSVMITPAYVIHRICNDRCSDRSTFGTFGQTRFVVRAVRVCRAAEILYSPTDSQTTAAMLHEVVERTFVWCVRLFRVCFLNLSLVRKHHKKI